MASSTDTASQPLVQACRWVMVSLFCLFLAAPAIQEHLSLLTYEPVIENRTKAPRPEGVLGIFDSESGYAQRYEAFFNDSYGLRDLLIKTKNQLDYWIFKRSDGVLVGEDGWVFYKQLYEKDTLEAEKKLDRLPIFFDRLLKWNALLAEQGITLVVVPCPSKTTMYPEHVPHTHVRYPQKTAFQRYREFLASHPEVHSVEVQQILQQLKPRMQIFHKTDFHWTDPAGAVVMKSLLSGLYRDAQLPLPPLPRVTTRREPEVSGGENNYLAIFFPRRERALMLEKPLAHPQGQFSSTKNPNQWGYVAGSGSQPNTLLPATVLIGDSFADAFLRAGLTGFFSSIHKIPFLEMHDKFHELPTGYRFVVMEHIESSLRFMLEDSWWPDELRERLDAMSPVSQTSLALRREPSSEGVLDNE